MWFILTVLLLALAGLVALFSCKALELAGKKTPLAWLRGCGSSFVANGLSAYGREARVHCVAACRRVYLLCRERTRAAGSALLVFARTLMFRFGEYLKRNGATGAKNDNVSSYMKDMLEYKKTQIDADAETQINADREASERE